MKRYFRNYSVVYDIEETYHIEDLKSESDYVIKELNRIEEERKKLERYLKEISNRANEVLQLEYYYFIKVTREKDYDNKINYYTNVCKCVMGNDGKGYQNRKVRYVENFIFEGRERRKALEKAEELKKEYNAVEIRKNF